MSDTGSMPPAPGSGATTVDFRGLIDWFRHHCDDSWEHQYGVRLETLDNPGWLLKVDLIHTGLQGRTMPELREGLSPDGRAVSPEWIHCHVSGNQFRGACDPGQVARLFQVFARFQNTASGQSA